MNIGEDFGSDKVPVTLYSNSFSSGASARLKIGPTIQAW